MLHCHNPAQGRGCGADNRHTDLGDGQQPVRVLLQLVNYGRPRITGSNQLCDPAFANGDYGKLGTGKKSVDDNQQENYHDFTNQPAQLKPLVNRVKIDLQELIIAESAQFATICVQLTAAGVMGLTGR
jgi:hypothetical protein